MTRQIDDVINDEVVKNAIVDLNILRQLQEGATNDELMKGKHGGSRSRGTMNVMECALGHDRFFANCFTYKLTYSN